jgi:hypothetical protein
MSTHDAQYMSVINKNNDISNFTVKAAPRKASG